MKISKDMYEKINDRLSDLEYNINILNDSVGNKKLTDKGKDLRNIGFVNGYIAALTDLDISFYAQLNGIIKLNPSCVDNDDIV